MFSCKILATIVSTCVTLLEGKELLRVWSIPSELVPILGVKELKNLGSTMIVLSRDDKSLELHLTIVLAIEHQVENLMQDGCKCNSNENKLNKMKQKLYKLK